MKALLVYPSVPDTYWSFKHILKFVRKRASDPPLGLLTVAAMLPRDWDLLLVDLNVEGLSDDQIRDADMVFIGAMVVQKVSVREMVNRCHRLGKKVVGGGPLFSSAAEEFDDVDHIVQGEAEVTLAEFLNDLGRGRPRHMYASEEKPDMTITPLPRWDLITMNHYASLSVQYSRGCPFNCEFCDIVKLNGRKPRVKSSEQMIREFDLLYGMGWRGRLFIVDDNFIGNKVKVKSMLGAIIQWQRQRGFPFSLYSQASVNLADNDELMQLMVDAGLDNVFLGLETPEEDSLRECGKYQNSGRDLLSAVRRIQAHGIEVMGGFIIGFDSDPPNIFDRQIHFIQESGVVRAMIGLLTAYPGTRLYERLKREGRLLNSPTGDNCDGSLNFVPKMDAQTLKEGHQAVLDHIYSPKHYYSRIIEFLKHYRPARSRRWDTTDLMAFFRSIVYIGILEKGESRIYYWKLLVTVLLFHREAFGEAISDAIFGYHFRKLLER